MGRLLFLALLFMYGVAAEATTYHIAHDGSDAANGTSTSTAWRTIGRMMQSIYGLQPGDQILFKRGGTYEGTLEIPLSGTSAQHIVVGAYGTGTAPVISGSKAVTGWTVHSGNIWKATIADDVKQLFVGGAMQTLARWPNTGWLTNDNGSMTSITDASITQASGYWTGARLVVRSSNWSYDAPTITGHVGTTITFGSVFSNLAQYDWGYYLCNKFSELDTPGEWFYNASTDQLYLWAPGNANPNNLSVRAQVREKGVVVHANIHHIDIQDLAFQHQNYAGFSQESGYNITVSGCTFSDLYKSIHTYGHDDRYTGNTIQRTQASGMFIIGDNHVIDNNIFQDIALVPGAGESTWGYIGLRVSGHNCTVRANKLTNIGYIGIAYEGGAGLVERNVVKQAMATLNDGGGIAFDDCDGLMIQENIVDGMVGNIVSSAPDFPAYHKICHGLYFGDSSIKNSTVQRNVVANCAGSGIHVDHTMLSAGNKVKDNVLYNNEIQISVSDASNYNGAGAVPPFHRPNFDDVYSGNTMYCLTADQWCMLQLHVYASTPVDFGTFTNNRYFNPWKEVSIWVHNTFAGTHTYYSLEQVQQELGEDAGSTRSAQRLSAHAVTSELSGELVVNGNFDANVNGWGGWPTNATATRDLTYLDNGALKAHLPNNSVYNTFSLRNPDQFGVQANQWYRMKFSLQSSGLGHVLAGVKGNSQLNGANVIHQTRLPFSPERREVELIFQSGLGDQSMVQFTNDYTDPMYWIDNVSVKKVAVTPVDPTVDHKLFYNDGANPATFGLPPGCWSDVNGALYNGSVTLQPFMGIVLFAYTGSGCSSNPPPTGTLSTRVFLGGPMNWSLSEMGDNLRAMGLVPTTEPYTALGLSVANAGATIPAAMLQTTGAQAIVDWVVVELRNANANYTVAERRAALVRRNGDVVGTDGNTLLQFGTATVGKHVVLRHRNHLAVMTAATVATEGQMVDLTSPSTALYGFQPAANDGAKQVLWLGDATGNGIVKYTGNSNDRDAVLTAVGGQLTTSLLHGEYRAEDVNMDGVVKFVGPMNDRDLVLTVIGGSSPSQVRQAQLP